MVISWKSPGVVALLAFALTFAAGAPNCWADGDTIMDPNITLIDPDPADSGSEGSTDNSSQSSSDDATGSDTASDAQVVQLSRVTVTASRPGPGNLPAFVSFGAGSTGLGGATEADPGKSGPHQNPATEGCPTANPVIPSDGNKVKTEVDFTTHQLVPLQLVRTYNHYDTNSGIFGRGWVSSFDFSLQFPLGHNGATLVESLRSDGSTATYRFNSTAQNYQAEALTSDNSIVQNNDGTWTLSYVSGASEHYSSAGQILSALDARGIGWTYAYNGSNQLTTATHTNGQSVSFGWTGNVVTTVKDTAGSTYNYSYNSSGMLSGVTYPNGDTRTYQYTDSADATALTGIAVNGVQYGTYSYNSTGTVYQSGLLNGSLEELTFSYSSNVNAGTETTTITNAAGAVTTNTYTNFTVYGYPRLTSVTQTGITNCANTSATTNFDGNANPSSSYDQRGIETTYNFTANGLLTDEVTGISPNFPGQQREIKNQWDSNNRLIQTNVLGANSTPISQTVYNYNPSTSAAKNRLASIVVTNQSPNGVANQTQTTTFSYAFYSSGMPSQITVSGPLAGPGGYVSNNYDSRGDLTSTTDALGHTTTYASPNGLGEPATVTDSNGYAVSYVYDSRGQVTSATENIAGVTGTTSYTYNGLGVLWGITYPAGGWVNYDLDGVGRVTYEYTNLSNTTTTTLKGGGSRQQSAWKSFGYGNVLRSNVTSVGVTMETDTTLSGGSPNDVETGYFAHSWGYDSLGRVTTDAGANGQSVTYTYDQDGNVLTKTDSLGNVTKMTYNAHNQVQTVTDPLNHLTSYTYDGAGNLASVTDPKSNVTSYVYDGLGNLVSRTSPDTYTTSYSHDNLGRLTQLTRANAAITSIAYDGMNRPTTITAGSLIQTRTYDSCTNGKTRLCTILDNGPSGATNSYTYRQNGQIQSDMSGIKGTGYSTLYAYDNQDRLTTIGYPDGSQIGYTYDTQSNITAMTATIGGTTHNVASPINYATMALGPPANMTLGDGSVRSFSYDEDYRLSALIDGSVQSYIYGYDTDNRLTTQTNNLVSANSETLGYDVVSRLTGVTSTGLGNQSIMFDANSNRTSATSGGITDTYSPASTNNQENSISGSRARTYTFDGLGNTKTETGWRGNYTYLYDNLNRLTSTNNGGTVYSYNGLNQRVSKTGTGGAFNYVYSSGGMLLGETAAGGTALTTEYLWLAGKLVGMIRNGVLYIVHTDQLSRPEVVTNASGGVVWQTNNTAFASQVTTNSFGGLNIGFPGQYYDAESGLYYNGARYYDSTTGRYIQSDPIGLLGGTNTYTYALNAPTMLVDPFGLWSAGGNLVIGGGIGITLYGTGNLAGAFASGDFSGISVTGGSLQIAGGLSTGVSYNPDGSLPGPATSPGNAAAGLFGNAGVGLGPFKAGMGASCGVSTNVSPNEDLQTLLTSPLFTTYGGISPPSYSFSSATGFNLGAGISGGIQIIVH